MGKRVREGAEESGALPVKKKSKHVEKNPLETLLGLLQEEGSLIAGLTYFLKTVTECSEEDRNAFVGGYLSQHPQCQHVLAPLQWDRDRRTYDVLLLCFKCLEQVLLFCAATPIPPPATPTSSNAATSTSSNAATSTSSNAATSTSSNAAMSTSTTPTSTTPTPASPIPAMLIPATATPTMFKRRHAIGHRLVQKLLTSHMKPVYHSLLSTVPAKLVCACLHLLVAMVIQGAESAKVVQSSFNFGYKPLSTFAGKTSPISDGNTDESVRQVFMKFALSFLLVGDPAVVSAVLELKGFLSSFFKLLPKDDAATAQLFLRTLSEKVVLNAAVSKKTKSQFFNQFGLKHLAMLLGHTPTAEGSTERVQQLAARLLDVLCTDTKLGVCYRSKDIPGGLERTNNPVLLHLLLSLSGRLAEPPVQDFIIRTLNCCPDLLVTYLRSLGLKFEPRPSSEWVVNMSFLIKVYSGYTPVPVLLRGGAEEVEEVSDPSPDLVGVAVHLTTPHVLLTRSHLSLGLQHPIPLVRYYTLQLIDVILKRAEGVVNAWGPVNRSLKSILTFLVQYCDAVLKTLPDIRTVIALRQRLLQSASAGGRKARVGKELDIKDLLPADVLKNKGLCADPSVLSCLSLSVLCGLQRLSPDILSQVNFSPRKLLEALDGVRGQEVCLALQINLDACGDRLSKNSESLATVLSLVASSDVKISSLARSLVHKLTRHVIHKTSANILMLSLCCALSTHPDASEGLLRLTTTALSRAQQEWVRVREEVRRVLGEEGSAEGLSLEQVCALPDALLSLPSTQDVDYKDTESPGDWGTLVIFATLCQEFLLSKHSSHLQFVHHVFLLLLLTSDLALAGQLTYLLLHYISPSQHPFSLHTSLLLDEGMSRTSTGCDGSLARDVVTYFHSHSTSQLLSVLESIPNPSRDELVGVASRLLDLKCQVVETPRQSGCGFVHNVQALGCSLFHSSPGSPTVSGDVRGMFPAEGASSGVNVGVVDGKQDQKFSATLGDMDFDWSNSLLPTLLQTKDWDQFLVTLLKSRFRSCGDLRVLSRLLPVVYGSSVEGDHTTSGHTPLAVVYDMIWSHSEFVDVMCLSSTDETKECLVELLISVVELEPSVCKRQHILALLGAYSATCSTADHGLLYLISLYEKNGIAADEYSSFLWGEAALERHGTRRNVYWGAPDISEILKLLDTTTLLRTASNFPVRLQLEPHNPFSTAEEGPGTSERKQKVAEDQLTLYDPCFLLPLFSRYLDTDSHVDCRLVVSHGVLCFLITALSSLCKEVRLASCHCLTRFKGHLQESRFREKPQISLLMDVLENTMNEDCTRLPSIFAAFAAKTSLLFLHADDPVFPVVSHYTVHKPAFDLRKFPLLFTMLHSSSQQAENERVWLLKVLMDGLRCKEDCWFYQRQQVFSHVTCLAASDLLSKRAKELAKKILQRGVVASEKTTDRDKVKLLCDLLNVDSYS